MPTIRRHPLRGTALLQHPPCPSLLLHRRRHPRRPSRTLPLQPRETFPEKSSFSRWSRIDVMIVAVAMVAQVRFFFFFPLSFPVGSVSLWWSLPIVWGCSDDRCSRCGCTSHFFSLLIQGRCDNRCPRPWLRNFFFFLFYLVDLGFSMPEIALSIGCTSLLFFLLIQGRCDDRFPKPWLHESGFFPAGSLPFHVCVNGGSEAGSSNWSGFFFGFFLGYGQCLCKFCRCHCRFVVIFF